MSSKRNRGSRAATVATGKPSAGETEALIQKGRFKDAVKQAKLCSKKKIRRRTTGCWSVPISCGLVSSSSSGWLPRRSRWPSISSSSASHSSEWADEFIRLLMSLGLGQEAFEIQDRFGAPEMKDQLVVMAADRAVIHPDRAEDDFAGNSGRCKPRSTVARAAASQRRGRRGRCCCATWPAARPSREWKYFVRGLAAYYRHDSDDMKANWDRLDPERKAFSIAQRLLRLWRRTGANTGRAEHRGHGKAGLWRAGSRPAAAGVQPGGQLRNGTRCSPAWAVAPCRFTALIPSWPSGLPAP